MTASVTVSSGSVPEAPAHLTAEGEPLQIRLSWTHSGTNVSGFKVERKLSRMEGGYTQLVQLPASERGYLDLGLPARLSYTYRVRAYNAVGDSAYSDAVSASPLASGG